MWPFASFRGDALNQSLSERTRCSRPTASPAATGRVDGEPRCCATALLRFRCGMDKRRLESAGRLTFYAHDGYRRCRRLRTGRRAKRPIGTCFRASICRAGTRSAGQILTVADKRVSACMTEQSLGSLGFPNLFLPAPRYWPPFHPRWSLLNFGVPLLKPPC